MADNSPKHPLQSPEWAQFRRDWGNEVVEFPFGIITVHKLPVFPFKIGVFEKGPAPSQKMLDALKEYAKENNLLYIKLEPSTAPQNDKERSQLTRLLRKNNCVPGKTVFTPSTFWIDLTRPEDDLLKSFHPKTRYNIRVTQKNGVGVALDNSDRAFNRYIELTRETVTRQGFYAHSERYHRLMWKFLKPAGIAHLLTARYKNQIITTWILFAYKDFLYYPYGASTEEHKNVMANNLMMWEAIRFGKKLGLKTFDLWGREPGKGFTKFKEGYNPQVIEFLGTWDLVINKPVYWIYRIIEAIRWPVLRLKSKLVRPSL